MEREPKPTACDAPPICRLLRTKGAFGNFAGKLSPWQAGRSSTAVYWCLATMEPWGTDDRIAHPETCKPGRACCEVRIKREDTRA